MGPSPRSPLVPGEGGSPPRPALGSEAPGPGCSSRLSEEVPAALVRHLHVAVLQVV